MSEARRQLAPVLPFHPADPIRVTLPTVKDATVPPPSRAPWLRCWSQYMRAISPVRSTLPATWRREGVSMDLAFYGRCSTEDTQDPAASRAWQVRRARDLVEPLGHRIVTEYFDVGESRSIPWKRRPEASRLLQDLTSSTRAFDGVVVGEPQRAFYGNQFGLTFPLLTHHGIALWVPEVGGQVDPDSEAHEIVMGLFGGMAKGERNRVKTRTKTWMHELAATTDRYLGGRPRYGYTLADAGPHPNRSKAAAGQRAHRLKPDPVTAPHVGASSTSTLPAMVSVPSLSSSPTTTSPLRRSRPQPELPS